MEIHSSKPYERFSFGLLVFTPKRITLYMGASAIYVLQKKFSFGPLVFTPKRILYEVSVIRVCARFSFGLLVFTPKRITLYMELWKSIFYARYFTPKQSTVIYGNDYALVLRSFIWPSVIGVLDKGAPKRLSLFVKRRGESLGHCKWMPLGEMSLGLAKLSGPQHPLVSVLNFSQSKRPSAQSAEGIHSPIMRNAEGMESPFMRKPKARAYLCELKSRRSPKRSPFVRKAEGMESPSAIMPKAS